MDVIDASTIDELFAPLASEFDAQTNQASPVTYRNFVMDRSPLESCERNVWDDLNSIEPLMLDLQMDTTSAGYNTTQTSMDYLPESLGPKMTAIYDPLYDAGSPGMKEGSAYSPRHEHRSRVAPSSKSARNASKYSRVVRTKHPVFPESSTPLSELKAYSSTSLSSKSSTVVSSDGSYPGTFASDPGHCDLSDAGRVNPAEDTQIQQFITEVLKPRKKLNVIEHEGEFEKSSSQSPVPLCESPASPLPPSTSKSALKIEMPIRYVKKITDLDRKILKLQAERAKLLEKGQSKVADDLEGSFESRHGSIESKSSVQLHYYAVGIPELDGACYNEGNFLLTSIGGINNDYRVAVENVCEKCNEKKTNENISNCLLYMKTLLVGHQCLKLHQVDGGFYQLLVQPEDSQMICSDLSQALAAANELLRITLQIVNSSMVVENRLKLVIETVHQLVQSCEATCDHLGITDERKVQIKNVLEGNQIALETALRLWPKSFSMAKNTLQAITNSMHPICNGT